MDPILEEKQNDQAQKKQSEQGIISRGINSINNLRGASRLLSNPTNKIGSKIVIQTGLRAFIASMGPALIPILITLITVVTFTVVIVGFGGVPSSEPNGQTTNVTPTPTPVP